ncbi:MAG: 3-oxoacyl-ACP reductase FabG [Ignavibacteriae bacterium]|nr:3-oxoacyl-ACP reductase FabG [Ignavibacteriota bacterium]
MIDLSNQIVLITGGSRGIGAVTALLFARAGANVTITYQTNKKAAEAVVSQVEKFGRKCLPLKGKIEKYSDCERMVRQTLEKFKRIDVLVNSADIWEMSEFGKMSPENWNRTIDVNLTGTFNMCNVVVSIMKKQRYGKIINVSSTAGQRGEANYSHYAASKGGLIAFTKSIAVELIRDGIWVNAVAPGWVETDMVSHVFRNTKQKELIFDSIPRGKIALPEEIAGPILFLASDLANHIVGEVLNVNGGSVLCG